MASIQYGKDKAAQIAAGFVGDQTSNAQSSISYGVDKANQILKGFKKDELPEVIKEHKRLVGVLESDSHEDDKEEAKKQKAELKEYEEELEKGGGGGKLDTSHLVLRDVNVGGKMMKRWVDPNKGNKEHAEHGSTVEFEHKGNKVKGKVGSVMKTGEYAIKGEDGKTYAKHPHQFKSSQQEDGQNGSTPKNENTGGNKTPEEHATKTNTDTLKNFVKDRGADPNLKEVAKKELENRGQTVEEEPDKAEFEKLLQADFGDEHKNFNDINQKFKTYENVCKNVVKNVLDGGKGSVRSAIIYGTGGVGKTFTLKQQLAGKKRFDPSKNEPGSDDYDYVVITGASTDAGIYKNLYEHNGKLVVFDDCDDALKPGSRSVDIFKGALDPDSNEGEISWASSKANKDSTGAEIPSSFKFDGGVIFISNLPPDKIPQPLKSRANSLDMSMTKDQTLDRIEHIAKGEDGQLTGIKIGGLKYKHEDAKAALGLLRKYQKYIPEINVRTFKKVVEKKHSYEESGESGWQLAALHELVPSFQKAVMEFEEPNENNIEKALKTIGLC